MLTWLQTADFLKIFSHKIDSFRCHNCGFVADTTVKHDISVYHKACWLFYAVVWNFIRKTASSVDIIATMPNDTQCCFSWCQLICRNKKIFYNSPLVQQIPQSGCRFSSLPMTRIYSVSLLRAFTPVHSDSQRLFAMLNSAVKLTITLDDRITDYFHSRQSPNHLPAARWQFSSPGPVQGRLSPSK